MLTTMVPIMVPMSALLRPNDDARVPGPVSGEDLSFRCIVDFTRESFIPTRIFLTRGARPSEFGLPGGAQARTAAGSSEGSEI